MIAIPELVCLLEQLLVCALVMLIVKFERFDQVAMYHLRLCIDGLNHIVKTSFNVDQGCTHCIYYVDITFAGIRGILDEVFLKLLISKA